MSRFISFAQNTKPLLDLLQKETWKQKKILEDLKKKPIEESLEMGDILGPLKIKELQKDIGLVFKQKGFFSRYRIGDLVDVKIYSRQSGFSEIRNDVKIIEVNFPEYGQIEVTTSIRKNLTEFSLDKEYYFFPSDLTSINQGIHRKLKNISEYIRKRNFPSIKIPNGITKEYFFNNLNNSQKEALKILADKGLEGRVQGPPGTGKTHLLKAIVELALNQNFTIGIAAFTHSAVDNAFSRIVSEHNDKCVRIGRIGKIKKDLYGKNFAKLNNVERFSLLQKKYSVYATTIHSWALSSSSRPKVDLLIVDEAGQVPIYFEPFLRGIGDRVIMLGDHKQLPPVLSVEVKDIKEDIFSMVKEDYMLEIQYRMNSDIQSWSSDRFYKNQLRPDKSVAERDILYPVSNNTLIGNSRVNLFLHEAINNSEYANVSEAEAVAKRIKILENNGVPLNEIGVITPYRMQAGVVNAKIQEEYNGDVSVMEKVVVDTVERFQGQEREIILLSFGANDEKPKVENKVFLGDGRRLNVSVTRAKSRFYCFSSKNLKNQNSDRIPKKSYLKDFLDWCGYMTNKREVA